MGKRLRANQVGVTVAHPEHGGWISPNPADTYDESDPLVKAHPWLFSTADELAERDEEPVRDSIPVEQATRAPGERRTTRRQR
ncbi:hypothetical protein ABZU92_18350 [Micromonospora arida]|uniref:hypothetical protein n=1 Tax=Micromonospora arida TaxID=2203715 RepID=UPI0033BE1E12